MSDQQRGEMLELAGLWRATSKAGASYLRGRLGGCTVMVMENKFKEKDSQPDYKILLVKAPAKQKGEAPSSISDTANDFFSV